MKLNDKSHEQVIWEELYLRIPFLLKKNRWKWESIVAFIGFGVAAFSFIVEVALSYIDWLSPDRLTPFAKEIGFVSLIFVLPSLTASMHCLDLLEKKLRTYKS